MVHSLSIRRRQLTQDLKYKRFCSIFTDESGPQLFMVVHPLLRYTLHLIWGILQYCILFCIYHVELICKGLQIYFARVQYWNVFLVVSTPEVFFKCFKVKTTQTIRGNSENKRSKRFYLENQSTVLYKLVSCNSMYYFFVTYVKRAQDSYNKQSTQNGF